MSWLDYADRDGGEFAYITHGNTIISNSLIKQGGLSVDRYTASGSFLEFGNVSASELSLTLDNSEEWFDWEKGDAITVEIDRERQSESTPTADNYKVGTFIVDSIAKSLNTVKVVALDSMVLLDVDFDWNVQTYDITTVLRRVATLCGITFTQNISGLANYNIEVPQYQCTCRTLVSNIAEVMGTCAYFNGNNELTFGWYEAGTITDFTEAVRVSSNVSENSYKVVNIAIGTSQDPRVELVKNGNEWNVTMRLLMSNPIVARHGNSLLADIIAKCYIINTSLHGMEAVTLPYPSVEPFQVFAYIDTAKSLNYLVPITNRTYSLNRNMAIKSVFNPENLTISNAFTNAGRAIVEEIEETVEETKKHFFFTTDLGAHITEIANDYTRGNNILIDSDSVDIRQGTNKIATFGADTVIGSSSGDNKNVYIASDRVQLREGTTPYLQLRKDTTSPYVMVGTLADGQQNLLLRPTGIWFRTRGTNDLSVIYDSTNDTPQITLGRTGNGEKNVRINNSELQMRTGTTVEASFGSTTTIGRSNNSHIEMDFNSLKLIDRNANEYFVVEDLRNKQGVATITQTFIADGSTVDFQFGTGLSSDSTNYTVTRNGTAVTSGITKRTDGFRFTTAPAKGATIVATYTTTSGSAKALTFGQRIGTKGGYSFASGVYVTASGYTSHAEGNSTKAGGSASHAEGIGTTASGDVSHAEGDNTTASGGVSHAEGGNTTASDTCSHAEGYRTTASGRASHAEGESTTASGDYSHAEGDGTTASGAYSHAEGSGTTASQVYAHAEGLNTTSSDIASHAEGAFATASGYGSHAEGYSCVAKGWYSHAQGEQTIANGSNQTALGMFNKADTTNAVILGNGDNANNRSNALTIDWSGSVKTQTRTHNFGGTNFTCGTAPTDAITLWGNSTYKVAMRVLNNADNKSFDLIARANYLTLYNATDSQTVWKVSPDEYQAGESVTFTANQINVCQGFVTNSTKSLDFQIPLPRSAKGRTCTLSLNASNGLTVRTGGGGYLNGTTNIDTTTSEYTVTCTPNDLGVWVRITKTTAYTGVTNNMACAVAIGGTLTFS